MTAIYGISGSELADMSWRRFILLTEQLKYREGSAFKEYSAERVEHWKAEQAKKNMTVEDALARLGIKFGSM